MKKVLLFFLCIILFLNFVYTQNNDDSQNQFAFEDEKVLDLLDALQESNEILSQKNDSIIQENEKNELKKKWIINGKKQNKDFLTVAALAVNVPFNLNSEPSIVLNKTSFPLGISANYVTSYMYIAFKGTINYDFIKYSEKNSTIFGVTFSFGITPIHNDYCFIGLYGTFCSEEIEKYDYTPSFGGSATALFSISNHLGIILNIDATYRGAAKYNGDEVIAPYEPIFLNSWRICPSIGVSYTINRG